MTRSQPEPSSGGAPPWGPRRYAADRDREVGRPRSAAALPPGGTAASPLAELTSWSAKQRRAEAALSPCMNRVAKGPLEISALASGAGPRLRRDACFQALAGERPRRRWKEVHLLLDPAPVPGSHAPACDGTDQVRSNRGSVPTIWLHAASTGWALPQRRNRAWPRLTMAREGWRAPNLREVGVRAQPLVLARAWLGGEGLCGGQARWFANRFFRNLPVICNWLKTSMIVAEVPQEHGNRAFFSIRPQGGASWGSKLAPLLVLTRGRAPFLIRKLGFLPVFAGPLLRDVQRCAEAKGIPPNEKSPDNARRARKSLRRRGEHPTSSFANQSRTGHDQQNPKG
jgi:hypothetical protein